MLLNGISSMRQTPHLLRSCPRCEVLAAIKTVWRIRHCFVSVSVYHPATISKLCVPNWSNGLTRMRHVSVFRAKRWHFRQRARHPYRVLLYRLFELQEDNLTSSTKRERQILMLSGQSS